MGMVSGSAEAGAGASSQLYKRTYRTEAASTKQNSPLSWQAGRQYRPTPWSLTGST